MRKPRKPLDLERHRPTRTARVRERVVDHGGLSLLMGAHPRMLPPIPAAEVVRRAHKRLRLRGAAPHERVRDEAFARYLIARWEEQVRKADRRAQIPPDLRNTDGDVFLLTTDHFDADPAMRSVVAERLAAIEGAEVEDGEGPEVSFVFVRPGNRVHRSWENTILGHARLSETGLRLETNSVKRADALLRRVESACGDAIRHRAREHVDPLSQKRPRRSAPQLEAPPEAAQLVLDLKERHYADWLDQPLPALKGKTPREAAQSAAGRSSLDVLLKDIENHERRGERATFFDVSQLRRALGME